jgi:thiamine biosynthesis lipoprotein
MAHHAVQPRLIRKEEHLFAGKFHAMASACELLIDTAEETLARHALHTAVQEAQRIEQKYSRYRDDSHIAYLVKNAGSPCPIDEETYRLLAFAQQLYALSDGMFDITSGVLRHAWRFDGTANIPSEQAIANCLARIGLHKVVLSSTELLLPAGMELDLGGIGKEYAVDSIFNLIQALYPCAFVINLGGDLRTQGPRHDGRAWTVGIEDPTHLHQAAQAIEVTTCAIATSGNSKRFVQVNGVCYGHLLNPKTGWPMSSGVRCATVAAETCTTAGTLTSLAMLSPEGATEFLKAQKNITFWTS